MTLLSLKDRYEAVDLPVLYVIAESDSGPCKIGYATNVNARFASLQVGNPRELTLHHSWRTNSAQRLERVMHARLAKLRIRGEWFNISPAEVKHLVQSRLNAVKRNETKAYWERSNLEYLKSLASTAA